MRRPARASIPGVRRYLVDGIGALVDQSYRPRFMPGEIDPAVEAAICEMRRLHPRYGPRTIVYWLEQRGGTPVPSRTTAYRALVRNNWWSPCRAGAGAGAAATCPGNPANGAPLGVLE